MGGHNVGPRALGRRVDNELASCSNAPWVSRVAWAWGRSPVGGVANNHYSLKPTFFPPVTTQATTAPSLPTSVAVDAAKAATNHQRGCPKVGIGNLPSRPKTWRSRGWQKKGRGYQQVFA